MIERLTDPSESEDSVLKLLSDAVDSARQLHELSRRTEGGVELARDHWLLVYLAVRDSLLVPNDAMLQQPEGFGEFFDPVQRFEDLRSEYQATGSPAQTAGTLAMLDMREAFAMGHIADLCADPSFEDDVTTRQMAELGQIGGSVARQVYRALDINARTQMPSAA